MDGPENNGRLIEAKTGQSPVSLRPRPRIFLKAAKKFRIFLWLLYASFIFLWFKDNGYALKKISISYVVPGVPLIGILLFLLVRKIKQRKVSLRLKFDRTVLALIVLLLLAAATRLPFCFYGAGMMTSDDAVPALMGKHIAEGRPAPICYYGQNYMGSLSSHIYALFFKLFGYSILVLKFSTLLIYLGFVALQFLLLKEVFSFSSAVLMCLFYSLPIGQLVVVSLENTSGYGLVLFLGSALVYTSYKIAYKKEEKLIPLLGFLMGLAFWTHQITASFILTAFLLLIFRAQLGLKKYWTLLVFGLLGGLPLLIKEIFNRFQMIHFLLGGEKEFFSKGKMKAAVQNLQSLIAPGNPGLGSALLGITVLGIAAILYVTITSKACRPQLTFLVFATLFSGTYILSRFGDKLVARYLFPLYFCLPVFLFAPFHILKSRIKWLLSAGLIAVILFGNSLSAHSSYFQSVKKEHAALHEVVAAMEKTGKIYWQADYWTAYLLTAISKEELIVDSFGINRYLPYRLLYYNQNKGDNYVFLGGPDTSDYACAWNLNQMLTTLGIPFRRNVVGDASLFFAIESPVFPSVLYEEVPSQIPHVDMDGVQKVNGSLQAIFKRTGTADSSKFRLNIEIPGYSAATVMLPESPEKLKAMIPAPPQKTFSIKYFLDYLALKIPATEHEIPYSYSGEESMPGPAEIVYLRGISSKVFRFSREVRYCGKDAAFVIPAPESDTAGLRLTLWSPFNFTDPEWYGIYAQRVTFSFNNGPPIERILRDGLNVIELSLSDVQPENGRILVTMGFLYHSLFEYANRRKIAAILEKVKVLDRF
jgi:hypothetical protein